MNTRSLKRKAMTPPMMLLAICSSVVISVLIFAGCSENPVKTQTSYFDLPYEDPTVSGPVLSAKHGGKSKEVTFYSGSGKVDAKKGGTVTLDMPKNWPGEFVVPEKSIEKDATIEVSMFFLKFGGTNIGIFDFSPDGLQFEEAATLQFDAHVLGQKDKAVDVYWLNEKKNRWEYQGTYPADKNDLVKIPIEHFSKYGVSD